SWRPGATRRSMRSGRWFRPPSMRRTDRAGRICLCLATTIALAACVPQPDTPTPVSVPPYVTPVETAPVSPTESPTPTAGIPIPTDVTNSLWPLAADLYYLTDQGQVFRQPYQSPDSPPVQISPQGVNVTDFAVAPGGEWLLVRLDGTITALSLAGKGSLDI